MGSGVDRRDLVHRLTRHLADGTTYYAPGMHREPSAAYTDPARFGREVDRLFRRSPTWVAWSAEIPEAGDWKTLDVVDVPVLLVRGADGVARGFRNTCAHRGATLVLEDRGCGARRFTCPYHGWCYDTTGRLVGVPFQEGFRGLDRGGHGLLEIPVRESYGLVFACLDPEGAFDLDEHLAGLGPELAAYGWDRFKFVSTRRIEARTNWKLAMDTYGEAYHFPYLHRESLAAAIPNVMEIDFFGPHVRQAYPFNPLQELRDQPEETWEVTLGHHLFIVYMIFPNLVLVTTDMGVSAYQVVPGATVGEVVTTDHEIVDPALEEDAQLFIQEFLEYAFTLVEDEDYTTAAGVFRSLAAGSLPALTFGRNEATLHHLHAHFDKAIEA